METSASLQKLIGKVFISIIQSNFDDVRKYTSESLLILFHSLCYVLFTGCITSWVIIIKMVEFSYAYIYIKIMFTIWTWNFENIKDESVEHKVVEWFRAGFIIVSSLFSY